MPDGKEYLQNTYRALKDNLDGFNTSEQDYYNKMQTDTSYRKKVYTALSDNLNGFNKSYDDFNGNLGFDSKEVQQQTQQQQPEDYSGLNQQIKDIRGFQKVQATPARDDVAFTNPMFPTTYADNTAEQDEVSKKANKTYEGAAVDKVAQGLGVKPEDVRQTLADFPSVNDAQALQQYTQLRKDNPVLYDRTVGNNTWQSILYKNVKQNKPEAYNDIVQQVQQSQQWGVGTTFQEAREHTRYMAKLINDNVVDDGERQQALAGLARGNANAYGGSMQGTDEALAGDKDMTFLNKAEKLGLAYLDDTQPDTAQGFRNNIGIDPTHLQQLSNGKPSPERVGYSEQKAQLAATGADLMMQNAKQHLADYDKIISQLTQGQQLSPEQQQDYAYYQKQYSNALDLQDRIHNPNDKEYGLAAQFEIDNITQELTTQNKGFLKIQGINFIKDVLVNPALSILTPIQEGYSSTENNKRLQLALIGAQTNFENKTYVRQANQPMQQFEVQMPSDLEDKITNINNDSEFSDSQKKEQIRALLSVDRRWYKKPTDPTFNLKGYGLLYGAGDAANSVLSFMTKQELLGAGADASKAQRIVSTFANVFVTDYSNKYIQNLKNNVANPSEDALTYAGVNAGVFAVGDLAGAIEKVAPLRKALGNTAANEVLSKLSDKEILDIAAKVPSRYNDLRAAILESQKGNLQMTALGMGATIANDAISGNAQSPSDYVKQGWLQYVTTLPISFLGIKAKMSELNDINRHGWYDIATKPEEYNKAADEMVSHGTLSPDAANTIKQNIEKASAIHQSIDYTYDDGKPMSDDDKTKTLLTRIKEDNLTVESKKNTSAKKQAENEHEAAVTSEYANLIHENADIEDLQKRKDKLQSEYDATEDTVTGKTPKLNDKERAKVKAQIDAIDNYVKDKAAISTNRNLDNEDIDKQIASLDKSDFMYKNKVEGLEKRRKQINDYYDNYNKSGEANQQADNSNQQSEQPTEESKPVEGIPNQESKPTEEEQVNADTPINNKMPFEDFRNTAMDMAVNMKDSGFDWRFNWPEISQKDREKGVADIKAGKDTAAAKKVAQRIQEMYDNGTITVNRGRGNNAETATFTFEHWFGTPEEQIKAGESLSDNTTDIVKSEGITADNLENFKHLFNGFPYEPSDYEAVKAHLAGQDGRTSTTTPSSEQSESGTGQTTPDAASESTSAPEQPTQAQEQNTNEVKAAEPAAATSKTKISTALRTKAASIRDKGILPDFLKADLPEGTQGAGITNKGVSEAFATALEKLADAIDAGKDAVDAAKEAFEHLKDYYKSNNASFDEVKAKDYFEKAAAKAVAENDKADESGGTSGIAQRLREDRATVIGKDAAPIGEGWNKDEALQRGRDLLKKGTNPKDIVAAFNKDGKIDADMLAVAQAYANQLAAETNKIGDTKGTDSPEYKAAADKEQQWLEQTKKMQTVWAKAGMAQQGDIPIDHTSITSIKKAKEKASGKPIANVPEEITALSKKVKDLEDKNTKLNEQLKSALDKKTSENKTSEQGKYEKTFKKAADTFRKLKTKPFTFKDENGNEIPFNTQGFTWNDLVETGAKAIEQTGKIADGVSAIVDKVKDADWYKSLSDKDKAAFKKQLSEHYEGSIKDTPEAKNIRRLQKQLDDLQQGKIKDKNDKRAYSQAEKDLQDHIHEEKVKLGLVASKMEKPTDEADKEAKAEAKNISRLEKELEDAKNDRIKAKPESREPSDKEKELQIELTNEKNRIQYESLAKGFAGKTDNSFTPEQTSGLWDYAKRVYIDNNATFNVADMVNSVAIDFGLKPEQVRNALASTPEVKQITEQVYRNQYEKKKAQQTIDNWVNKGKGETTVGKFFGAISAPFRNLATLGHGHALLFTHAGMNLFDPQVSKAFFKASIGQFKLVYGKPENYQKAVNDMEADPLFATALKAGTAIDPHTVYDDWQLANGLLGKFKIFGNNGFLVLKAMRFEIFKNEYNKLSAIEKADDKSVKQVAQLANHWTGTAGINVSPASNAFIFAPNLIVSKFARLTTDPLKATVTLGKLIAGKEVSTEDRVAAKIIVAKTGRIMATYVASLVANQAMLSLAGSTQTVNLTHPLQSDWLKYKLGDAAKDKTVDLTSGMASTMQFLASVAELPFEAQKETANDYYGAKNATDAAKSIFFGYIRKSASPMGSVVLDFTTHTDFAGNVLPVYDDKPKGSRVKLDWLGYVEEKLPIPIAETFNVVHEQMRAEGVPESTASQIMQGILIGAIASTGIKISNSPTMRPSPFNEQDKKDPTFKYFIDKGLSLPNTSLSAEKITDNKKATIKSISDYPQDIQDKYQQVHKEELKKVLAIKQKSGVYLSTYKDAQGKEINEVTLAAPENRKYKKVNISSLDKDELTQVLSTAQSLATKRAKAIVFKVK